MPEMADNDFLRHEMVDKWSIKPSLASKMADILLKMADKSQIRTENLVTELGLAETTAKRYLRQLTQMQFLEVHGSNRNRYYTFKNKLQKNE